MTNFDDDKQHFKTKQLLQEIILRLNDDSVQVRGEAFNAFIITSSILPAFRYPRAPIAQDLTIPCSLFTIFIISGIAFFSFLHLLELLVIANLHSYLSLLILKMILCHL